MEFFIALLLPVVVQDLDGGRLRLGTSLRKRSAVANLNFARARDHCWWWLCPVQRPGLSEKAARDEIECKLHEARGTVVHLHLDRCPSRVRLRTRLRVAFHVQIDVILWEAGGSARPLSCNLKARPLVVPVLVPASSPRHARRCCHQEGDENETAPAHASGAHNLPFVRSALSPTRTHPWVSRLPALCVYRSCHVHMAITTVSGAVVGLLEEDGTNIFVMRVRAIRPHGRTDLEGALQSGALSWRDLEIGDAALRLRVAMLDKIRPPPRVEIEVEDGAETEDTQEEDAAREDAGGGSCVDTEYFRSYEDIGTHEVSSNSPDVWRCSTGVGHHGAYSTVFFLSS